MDQAELVSLQRSTAMIAGVPSVVERVAVCGVEADRRVVVGDRAIEVVIWAAKGALEIFLGRQLRGGDGRRSLCLLEYPLDNRLVDSVKNPALQVLRDQASIIARISDLFGLTPSDRVGLEMTPRSSDDDRDSLISGGGYPFDV